MSRSKSVKVGTCTVCGRVCALHRGLVVEHANARRLDGEMCSAFRRPLEYCMAAKAGVRARAQRTVDDARDTAAVALDALEVGRRELAEEVPALLKLALVAYRLAHGGKTPKVAWRWEPRSTSRRARMYGHALGDVYCIYCGGLLHAKVRRDKIRDEDHESSVFSVVARPHVTRCALQVLAGIRPPAAPGTKRPSDVVMEWAAEAAAAGEYHPSEGELADLEIASPGFFAAGAELGERAA